MLCACSFQQQQQFTSPERWMYIMCIRHESKDIAVLCMNNSHRELSALPPSKQAKMPEFKNFQVFGKRGVVETDWSFIPQVTDKLNYIVNEVVLSTGESIVDFNGFTISAEHDALAVSNKRKKYRIKEKNDWNEITSQGGIDYAGHYGPNPVSKWQMCLYSLGLREDMWDYPEEKDIKKHRFFKWCVSPIEGKPDEFQVQTRFIPNAPVLLCIMRETWYKSTWE